MIFNVPGFADEVCDDILSKWNGEIIGTFRELKEKHRCPFFVLDSKTIPHACITWAAKWLGSPAIPEYCRDVEMARNLCDLDGRSLNREKDGRSLHIEYVEYCVIYATDKDNHRRPKRVEITTELKAYWLILAAHTPRQMKSIAESIVGKKLQYADLYGPEGVVVEDLSPEKRSKLFGDTVFEPNSLYRQHALFLLSGRNQLDDLMFPIIVGAQPHRVTTGAQFRKAETFEILAHVGKNPPGCRHAYRSAIGATHDAAWQGQTVAFYNPLGVYIRSFNEGAFRVNGDPLPSRWIQRSRGKPGLYQHLSFGPTDEKEDENAFLKDITVTVGNETRPLTGGYDVLRQMEVGPILVVGQPGQISEDEFEDIEESPPVNCRDPESQSEFMAVLKAFQERQSDG